MDKHDAKVDVAVWIKEAHRPDVRRTCGPDAQGNYVGRGGMLIPDISLMVTQPAFVRGIGTSGQRALVRFPRDIELWVDLAFLTMSDDTV